MIRFVRLLRARCSSQVERTRGRSVLAQKQKKIGPLEVPSIEIVTYPVFIGFIHETPFRFSPASSLFGNRNGNAWTGKQERDRLDVGRR